ncbi:uncharacterized protein LOC117100251 [Anneissia japonica]|uniref:uncharacterized protein LOC117100251 n=1 Tax=Anneissia japonica TaxID=1529436 RepID=UPI0014259D2A|nr:uncharacterized protein LOC117100251 [Anneissia japonica]
MRKYFMINCKKKDKDKVGKFLLSQRQDGALKCVDFGDQETQIFKADVDINTFDITILMTLIQHCCSSKGDSIWKKPPDDKDKSLLANLRRIQLYKETTLDCSPSNRVTNVEFDKQWYELTTTFTCIGVSAEDIEKYHKLRVERSVRGFEEESVEEIRNFQVLQAVVIDVGTVAMREYFLEVANRRKTKQSQVAKLEKKDVGQYLINMKSNFKVKLNLEQKKKMFTPNADIDTFDITIMYLIIRNCCSIPDSFWEDPQKLSNVVEIHRYRNTLAHYPNCRVSNKDFEIQWTKVRSMLHNAGAPFQDIDKYRALKFIN